MHGHIQGLEHGGIMIVDTGWGWAGGTRPLYVSDIKYFRQKRKDTYTVQ